MVQFGCLDNYGQADHIEKCLLSHEVFGKLRFLLLGAGLCVWLIGCFENQEKRPFFQSTYLAKSEWPVSFTNLAREAEEEKIDTDSFRAYLDSEYYFECKSSPQLLTLMTKKWELVQVESDFKIVRRFRQRLPNGFFRKDTTFDYYACQTWIKGEKGNLFCVIDDGEHLWVRHYFNF